MFKSVITGFSIAALTFSLISCSSNTQKQNTGIGAVTGAVAGGLLGSTIGGGTGKVVAIGAGAVIGALIGGEVGKSMDSADTTKTTTTLNNNATNKTTTWKNAQTGSTYKVTPTSGYITVNGNPNCRTYRTTAMINGKKQVVYGTACKQADGTWQTVNT